ncbi:hypothetical protein [Streptoalloteichus tenebrarius]|nr:hypothetical protein [Streptoalloteichus tenebrarius]
MPRVLAEEIAQHLVAAGQLVDSDPERALAHARYARTKAARVGAVREAAGLTAYHAGEWAEALSELRAARRMTGGPGHVAVMADCERALGRPERALELLRGPEAAELPHAELVELRIVAAGARRDMGQLDAAVVALQGPDLDPSKPAPWNARLFYAYADNLAAVGRTEEAIRWFLHAAEADQDEETDAAERAYELSEPERAEAGHDEETDAAEVPETERSEAEAGSGSEAETDAAETGAEAVGPTTEVGEATGDATVASEAESAADAREAAEKAAEKADEKAAEKAEDEAEKAAEPKGAEPKAAEAPASVEDASTPATGSPAGRERAEEPGQR